MRMATRGRTGSGGLLDWGNPVGADCSCATHVRFGPFGGHLGEQDALESEGSRMRSVGFECGSLFGLFKVSLPTNARTPTYLFLVLYPTCDFSYSFCLWQLPSKLSRKSEKKNTTCLSPHHTIRICPSPVFTSFRQQHVVRFQ
jgi:hypothetical protein